MKTIYALVNHSTKVDAHQARAIADAVHRQLQKDVGPAWGRTPPAVVFYAHPDFVPAGAPLIALVDADTTPDALGYHDESGDRPYANIIVPVILQEGGDVLTGPNSVASVVSHEAIEMFGDVTATAWRDFPLGGETAEEWCDAVQDGWYAIVLAGLSITVSNFLHPAWFDAQAPSSARFDQLGALSGPFTRTSGGYLIVRKTGKESQLFGERPPWRASSRRLARRGVRHG